MRARWQTFRHQYEYTYSSQDGDGIEICLRFILGGIARLINLREAAEIIVSDYAG